MLKFGGDPTAGSKVVALSYQYFRPARRALLFTE
jgi:hypothetical protein